MEYLLCNVHQNVKARYCIRELLSNHEYFSLEEQVVVARGVSCQKKSFNKQEFLPIDLPLHLKNRGEAWHRYCGSDHAKASVLNTRVTEDLEALAAQLKTAKSWEEKERVLRDCPTVRPFFENHSIDLSWCTLQERTLCMEIVGAGQGALLLRSADLQGLFQALLPMYAFYQTLGGIVGYQATMLRLLLERQTPSARVDEGAIAPPDPWDLSRCTRTVRTAIDAGIESLPLLCEIYPLGGAGDRLALREEKSGAHLPVATLPFMGKTLLQGLIEDVQAREHLYFQKTGKRVITPIAIMTSHEKGNHQRVLALFEQCNWFGRPKESFRFVTQPLVPVMDKEGRWLLKQEGELLLKPGGHGVLWKLLEEGGIFEWFKEQGRTKALVRQVNNPIAGTDYGLLAFTGIGILNNKELGFASCPRLVGSQEGMNVVIERRDAREVSYALTNIEYCTFEQRGIQDQSVDALSNTSLYPSNTNILFVDLNAVQRAIQTCPIPGMLVNLKPFTCLDQQGRLQRVEGARLESTMQNIADALLSSFSSPLSQKDLRTALKAYLTTHVRRKTISCTKRRLEEGGSIVETPEGAFWDVLCNAHELLANICRLHMPPLGTVEGFLKLGPPFLFSYLPALGPLWEHIAKKICKGSLALGSALDLQLSALEWENVCLDGALRVVATHPFEGGRCTLKNVKILNAGVDRLARHTYWSGEIRYKERLEIVLEGSGQFIAEGVTIKGGGKIVAGDGALVRAVASKDGTVHIFSEPKKNEP